jgi:hypothetical protein
MSRDLGAYRRAWGFFPFLNSFAFPPEVKQINPRPGKSDSEMGPQVGESLARLLSLRNMSVRAWRKGHV